MAGYKVTFVSTNVWDSDAYITLYYADGTSQSFYSSDAEALLGEHTNVVRIRVYEDDMGYQAGIFVDGMDSNPNVSTDMWQSLYTLTTDIYAWVSWTYIYAETNPPTTIKGEWIFPATMPTLPLDYVSESVDFTSNGLEFGQISVTGTSVVYSQGNYARVYDNGVWTDEKYRIVDFGTTEQTVKQSFYTQFTSAAEPYTEPVLPPATITYNGNVLAELEEGQTAIFPQGVKAKTDVSIVFGSDGRIEYKGVATEIDRGKTANLKCEGKKFGTEVVVTSYRNLVKADSNFSVTSKDGNIRWDADGRKVILNYKVDSDTYFFVPLIQSLAAGTKYTLAFDVTGMEAGMGIRYLADNKHYNVLDLFNGRNKVTFTAERATGSLLVDDALGYNGTAIGKDVVLSNFALYEAL